MRRKVRSFVDSRVVPAEQALDLGNQSVLATLRAEATESGLWSLPHPVEFGGGGVPLSAYLDWAEDEGRSDHGPDVLGSASLLNARMVQAHADPALREEVLPRLVREGMQVSYAMTEPGVAGSDPAGLCTVAERAAGGGWTVTGRKWFTSGAARAELVMVVARTETGAPPREAFSILAVPTGAAGFEVVRELDVLGAGGQYEIAFDRVRVPATHLLGARGDGLRLAGERLALGRTLRALRWVGQAQRALEQLARRVSERRIGGGVLADRQLIQQLVFEAELALRGARELTARAAELVAHGRPASVEVSLAKVAAARALGTAVDGAIQAYGAEGLTSATGLPRLLRTARAARILDGADELHVSTTGRRLLRGYQREFRDVEATPMSVGGNFGPASPDLVSEAGRESER